MRKIWDFINDKRYFTFFFIAFLALIKICYNNFGIPIIYQLYAVPIVKFGIITICAIAILNLMLLLIVFGYVKIRYNQWVEEWQKVNKGEKSEKILAIFLEPQATFAAIIYYGFFLVFSVCVPWLLFFSFFALAVFKNIYTTFIKPQKTAI